MTINTNNLVANWILAEYDYNTIIDEYLSLKNGIWAFFDNGLIANEQREREFKKLQKAFDEIARRYND